MSGGWQPIETAPRDGATPVLGFRRTPLGAVQQVVQFIRLEGGGANWCIRCERGFIGAHEPTHWMPLPEPPNSEMGATPGGKHSAHDRTVGDSHCHRDGGV